MGRRYLFILTFCLAFVTQVTLSHAVEYGGLGGVPANPDPANSRTKSIFIYSLAAGSNKLDGVRVVNNSSETKVIELYSTDSEIASGGSFACKQKDEDKKDVGAWLNLTKKEVTLSRETSEVVPFSVTIPQESGVGEHNGCLVIQEKDKNAEQSNKGVQLNFRSAIRVAVTIPGDIKKDVEFNDILIKSEPKKYVLTAQLYNKGNVSVDTDVQVHVKDFLNRNVYQNGGVYPLLAQKQPVELNFEWERPFWGGLYRVIGAANYNGDPNVSLGGDNAKNTRRNAPTKILFVQPQPVAAAIELVLLVLLIVFIYYLIRRLKKSKKASKTWGSYTVRSGDTLVSLARSSGGGWKTIARVNKLRAPYELKPGTTIKLPTGSKSSKK